MARYCKDLSALHLSLFTLSNAPPHWDQVVFNAVKLCLQPFTSCFQNVQMEEAGSSPRPETPSTLTETEGDMEGSLLEVDLDSYQTTLEEVLTWLLSAEDALQIQDEVSDDVEEVKEQFHTHEVDLGLA